MRKPVAEPAARTPNPFTTGAGLPVAAARQPFVPVKRPAAPAPRPAAGLADGRGIELSLQPVVDGLPLELQSKLIQKNVGAATITVPLDKILSQLPRGTVHLSYGELRAAAPFAFTQDADRDKTLVSLPLGEILARVNPGLLSRRRAQRQLEIPAEITSPFDTTNPNLTFSLSPARNEPAPVDVSAGRQAGRMASIPTPGRGTLTMASTPPPPAAEPITSPGMVSAARAMAHFGVPQPAAVLPQAPKKIEPPKEVLTIPLTALAEGMPEAVRKEIVLLNLVDSKVALPVESVEQALKQGRIVFSWKTLCSWIDGATGPSQEDATVVELPLKVVAPLFLARKHEDAKKQQKVNIDTEIPNLFFGFPQPDSSTGAAGASVAKPVDTNYYVWGDENDTAPIVNQEEVKRAPVSPGTRFISRCATPNEVVSRAAVLDGVAGALIALPDGLMVASRLAADLNGDTLAAFLPQIFSKVTQCTKELRMGELNNLNFTVGNVPWKIFRVNAIFFAAFGRAGAPLPGGPLAALAAELDHRAK